MKREQQKQAPKNRRAAAAARRSPQNRFRPHHVGLLLLGAILFYSPYLRGLFFQREQEWTLLLACLAFVLVWLGKLQQQEVSVLGRPLDYLALGFVLLYVASAFGAASQRLAVAEVVKVLLYFLVYWMASQLGREEGNRSFLAAAVYVAAVGVALAGILTAQGVVSIKDGFVGGRIYSTLQYPNALASYLAAASFFGLFLWARAPRPWRFALAAGTYLLFLVLLGTGSRGGLVLYPAIMVLFFLGAPAGLRGSVAWHVAGSWVAALVANSRFLPLVLAGQKAAAWSWVALGLAVALAAQGGFELARQLNLRRQATAVAAVAAGVLAVAGVVVYLRLAAPAVPASTVWQRLVPPQLLARLQDISLATFGAASRIQWSEDALKLVWARPVLGYGGGAWEAAYQSFQSYYYTSTQVHNHYFQVWTEVGTVGLLAFLGLWFFFLLTAFRNYRRTGGPTRLFQWAVLGAAATLGLHAVMDFDLVLGAVALVLWTCFGLTRGLERELGRENYFLRRREYGSARYRYLAAVLLGAVAAAWLPSGLLLGEAMARRAVAAVHANQAEAAETYFRRASFFDPFSSSYRIDLAGLLLARGRVAEAVALAEKAARQDPFNRRVLTRLGEIYWQAGRPEEAVRAMEQARQAAPWVTDGWENLGRAAAMAGIKYLASGEREKAAAFFREATAIPAMVRAKMAGLPAETRRLWEEGGRPLLTVTPAMELNAGIGHYGLGQIKEALPLLERAAADPKVKAEALYWASLSYRQLGDLARAQALRQEMEALAPELAKSYEEMARIKPL